MRCVFALPICLSAILISACNEPQPIESAPRQWPLHVFVTENGVLRNYAAIGSVVSDSRIEVSSRLSGYLRELRVREGDHVTSGQSIARIDAPDVDAAIRQAEAGRIAAQAAFDDANVDLERFRQLQTKGFISDSDLRKAQLKVDAARESLNQATAAHDNAQEQRRYAHIASPVSGSVVAVLRKPGDLVVPGAPILLVEGGRDLLFETTVNERQVAALKAGQPVNVSLDGMDRPLKGSIARIVQSADPVTRTYPVKIALKDTRGVLPGMFGRAELPLGREDGMVLPRAAIAERGGLKGTFVVDAQQSIRFRWLRLGREWPDRVEVLAGISPGEPVALSVPAEAHEGDLVEVLAETTGDRQ